MDFKYRLIHCQYICKDKPETEPKAYDSLAYGRYFRTPNPQFGSGEFGEGSKLFFNQHKLE